MESEQNNHYNNQNEEPQTEEDKELERLKQEYMQRENEFIKQCEEHDFWRKVIEPDGNCMFAALCTLYHIYLKLTPL